MFDAEDSGPALVLLFGIGNINYCFYFSSYSHPVLSSQDRYGTGTSLVQNP